MPFFIVLVVIAVILLVAGLRLRTRAEEVYEETGLPPGEIIYQDTVRTETEVLEPLFSRTFRLAGKPDYLIEENGEIIPVEVKSGRTPAKPYDSHVFQLAAYCLLVSDIYGRRPSHGIIRYANRQFAITYDEQLEDELLRVMDAMRFDVNASNVHRNHDQAGRCIACSFRYTCDEALD
jgi:CRISPR-associated exonuclease Cas4